MGNLRDHVGKTLNRATDEEEDLGPMLALCCPMLALSCPYVGPMLAYVDPM